MTFFTRHGAISLSRGQKGLEKDFTPSPTVADAINSHSCKKGVEINFEIDSNDILVESLGFLGNF